MFLWHHALPAPPFLAALGIACARDLAGDDYNVIAVIGDGALTGGEAMEGLNNVGDMHKS